MGTPNLNDVRRRTDFLARCFDSGDYGLSEAKKHAKLMAEKTSAEEVEATIEELFNFIRLKGRDSLRKQCPFIRE